jgi:hypothetical protein
MDRPATAIELDLLDRLLPRWHWRSRSTAMLAAPARETFGALLTVTLAELPSARTGRGAAGGGRVVDELLRQGYVPLAPRTDTSLVLGRTGHMWRAGGPPTDAGGFATFDQPGHAKAVLLWAARPYLDETVLVTEVRLWANDPRTFRGFSRHWLMASWARELSPQQLVGAVRRRLGVSRFTDRPRGADGR